MLFTNFLLIIESGFPAFIQNSMQYLIKYSSFNRHFTIKIKWAQICKIKHFKAPHYKQMQYLTTAVCNQCPPGDFSQSRMPYSPYLQRPRRGSQILLQYFTADVPVAGATCNTKTGVIFLIFGGHSTGYFGTPPAAPSRIITNQGWYLSRCQIDRISSTVHVKCADIIKYSCTHIVDIDIRSTRYILKVSSSKMGTQIGFLEKRLSNGWRNAK